MTDRFSLVVPSVSTFGGERKRRCSVHDVKYVDTRLFCNIFRLDGVAKLERSIMEPGDFPKAASAYDNDDMKLGSNCPTRTYVMNN